MADTPRRSRSGERGTLALTLALLCWSFGPPLSKRVGTAPLVTVFYRFWVAAILHWLIGFATGRAPDRAVLRRTALPGVLFAGNLVAFFYALHHASVANVALITSLQPVAVLFVAGPLFGERVSRWDVCWTLVALAGAIVAVVGSNSGRGRSHTTLLGLVLSVVALVTFTAYFLLSKRASQTAGSHAALHPITYMAGVLTTASIVLTPVSLVASGPASLTRIGHADLLWLVGIILVPSTGHLFMSSAHRSVPVSVSSLALLIQPVTVGLAAWLINHESLAPLQILGAVIVLVALGAVVSRRNTSAVSPSATVSRRRPPPAAATGDLPLRGPG